MAPLHPRRARPAGLLCALIAVASLDAAGAVAIKGVRQPANQPRTTSIGAGGHVHAVVELNEDGMIDQDLFDEELEKRMQVRSLSVRPFRRSPMSLTTSSPH